MNKRIQQYVESLFEKVPASARAQALKEEIMENMEGRYMDFVDDGKNEGTAFTLAVSSFGDMEELLKEVQVQEEKPFI